MDTLEKYLDRDDFKMVTYEPSKEGVLPDPVTVQEIKVFSKKDPERIVKLMSNGHIADDVKHLTPADVLASINYFFDLQDNIGTTDDIDHLGNRRIRRVGELLQNQFRIGLARMERVVRERMSIQDINCYTTTINQYSSSCCQYQRILWFITTFTVHGSTQPTW